MVGELRVDALLRPELVDREQGVLERRYDPNIGEGEVDALTVRRNGVHGHVADAAVHWTMRPLASPKTSLHGRMLVMRRLSSVAEAVHPESSAAKKLAVSPSASAW